jgi:hypothetical protein
MGTHLENFKIDAAYKFDFWLGTLQIHISRRSKFEKRQTDVTGENIHILLTMLNQVDKQMEDAIDKMPLRKMEWACYKLFYFELS